MNVLVTQLEASGESRIPVLGKSVSPTPLSSRLVSLSHKVRAHLTSSGPPTDSSKLRSNSGGGMLLSFLGPGSRSKASKRQQHQHQEPPAVNGVRPQRPTGFQKALEGHRFYSERQSTPERHFGLEEFESDFEKVGLSHLGKKVCLGGCKLGVLKFFGKTDLGPGLWCGIELDTPEGLNDGSVNGIRYFTCPPNRGVLAPEFKVTVPRYADLTDSGPHSLLVVSNERDVERCEACEDVQPTDNTAMIRLSGGSLQQSDSRISTPGSAHSGHHPSCSLAPDCALGSSRHSSSASSLVLRTAALNGSLQEAVASLQHSKHSSFELDESLGILTPDQMTDFTLNYGLDDIHRTPSCDELSSLMLQDIEFSELTMDSSKRNSLEVRTDDHESLPEDNATFLLDGTVCSNDKTLIPFDECGPRESEESRVSSLTVVNSGERSLVQESIGRCDMSEEVSDNIESKKSSDPLSSYCNVGKKEHRDRMNRTPSVEDLPLDASEGDRKAGDEGCRGVVLPNSFITSITSITSLDNGYQGDGEWSRPASRGPPDHSPSAHQKLVKPRIDPMTDSDFFTESDADMHEECGGGHLVGSLMGGRAGDRRAQVIDGTLYGGGTTHPTNHACNTFPMGVNNHHHQRFSPTNEEMDSSGIYSDLDKRGEEQICEEVKSLPEDDCRPSSGGGSRVGTISPEGSIRTMSSRSDQSLKKLSPTAFTELINEQVNTIKNLVASTIESELRYEPYEEIATQTTAEELVGTKSQSTNDTNAKPATNNKMEPGFIKKYKMPKRNVVSKIKTMITSGSVGRKENIPAEEDGNKVSEVGGGTPQPRLAKTPKKGRWDEVMSKIAQGQAEEKSSQRLKEVKSKVFAGITLQPVNKCASPGTPPSNTQRVMTPGSGARKSCSSRSLSAAQSISTRSLRDIPTLKSKSRRSRLRGSENCLPVESQASSRNSSVSDISQGTQTNAATPTSSRSGKKRDNGRCSSPQIIEGSGAGHRKHDEPHPPTSPPHQPTPTATSPPPTAHHKTFQGKSVQNGEKVGQQQQARKVTPKRSTTVAAASQKPTPLRDQNRVNGVVVSGAGSGGGGGGDGPSVSVVICDGRKDRSPPGQVQAQGQGVVALAEAGAVPHSPARTLPPVLQLPPPPPPPDPKALSALRHASAGVQALGVLVNYLVYSLDAFSAPKVKNDLEKMKSEWIKTKLELEETQASYNRLEDTINSEKVAHEQKLNEIFENHKSEQSRAQIKHQLEIENITIKYNEKINEIETKFSEQEKELKIHFQKEIDVIKKLYKTEIDELKANHEKESTKFKEAIQASNAKLEGALNKEAELEKQIDHVNLENSELKQKLHLFAETINSDKDSKLKGTLQRISQLESEVSSLRSVLEIRSDELQEQRRQSQVWQRDAEQLPQAVQKITTLKARLEDLQAQLEQKEALEQDLVRENRTLLDTVSLEAKEKKRLSMHNEELQWKLKQNTEVANVLVALCGDASPALANAVRLQRTPKTNKKLTFNANIRRSSTDGDQPESRIASGDQQCPAAMSDLLQGSPPTSPKVKAIVEKNDSVAWVLDMDEPPEYIASRILRRAQSLRASSTPCTTPTHQSLTLPPQHKQRSRSSKSLSLSSPTKTTPEPLNPSGNNNGDKRNAGSPQWDNCSNIDDEDDIDIDMDDDDDDDDEEEHITEEVIMVKSIGDKNVLEFLNMEDNSEIHIEVPQAAPKKEGQKTGLKVEKEKSEEELQMIRRVEESGLRDEITLPKDSAGEAMISEETSDDDIVSEDESNSEDIIAGRRLVNEKETRTSREIKIEAKVVQQSLISCHAHLSDSGSLSNTAMDLSWSEDAELLPSEG